MERAEFDKAMNEGKQAEARVGSILRGGHVYEGNFYFCSARREKIELSSVRDLRYAPYN